MRRWWILAILVVAALPAGRALALVDINTASATELEALPGVGPSLAAAIVEYRTANGPFITTRDVMSVPRVGDALYAQIVDEITLGGGGGSGSTAPYQPGPRLTAEEVMSRFDHEPGIQEVQAAAMDYAEIRPDQITRWRSTVRSQALLPEFKVDVDHDTEEDLGYRRKDKISISGGTVTVGPDEITKDRDTDNDWSWGVTLTWDLDEYVFNKDMFKVADEAEDMAEFRSDVLAQVTKLYFDRRRLQVQQVLHPARSLDAELQSLLRLEELTAGLDALTGGAFTAGLAAE